jgi:hypothetical protein
MDTNSEPTTEQYLKWYNDGLITIFPLTLGTRLFIIVIPIPQKV